MYMCFYRQHCVSIFMLPWSYLLSLPGPRFCVIYNHTVLNLVVPLFPCSRWLVFSYVLNELDKFDQWDPRYLESLRPSVAPSLHACPVLRNTINKNIKQTSYDYYYFQ